MPARNRMATLVLIFSYISSLYIFGQGKLLVKKFGNCDSLTNYNTTINVTFKTVGDLQYVDASWTLMAPIDNNLKRNVSVEMLVGSRYVHTLAINDRRACESLNKFFGEFWYDIERNSGLIPGLCPIPKGTYHLHNFLLNYGKITTLQNFPFGKFRFTTMLFYKNDSVNTCVLSEIEYGF